VKAEKKALEAKRADENNQLKDNMSRLRQAKHLTFFFASYKARYWYWEVVECSKKLWLVSKLLIQTPYLPLLLI
jgi:hypothetical protein